MSNTILQKIRKIVCDGKRYHRLVSILAKLDYWANNRLVIGCPSDNQRLTLLFGTNWVGSGDERIETHSKTCKP